MGQFQNLVNLCQDEIASAAPRPRNDRKDAGLAMTDLSVIASPEGAWRSPCQEIASAASRPRNDRKGCSTPAKEGASGSGGDVVRTGLAVAVAAVMLLTMSGLGAGQQPVTITYWQYFFQRRG